MIAIHPELPRRVLTKAYELDPLLHEDCLVLGSLCPKCHDTVMAAFDFYYGHCSDVVEVIAAIAADFHQDRAEGAAS